MSESRRYFHGQLGEIREDMLRLAAAVLEGLPRATDVLLMSDLEAIEHIIEEDDKLDAQALTARGSVLFRAGAPAADGGRLAVDRGGHPDDLRDRALR